MSDDILLSRYECNICLEQAKKPVVTRCGHLYCWRCIYSWLDSGQFFLSCPVCKNGVTTESLVPVYLKEEDDEPPDQERIPNRPMPQRVRLQSNPSMLSRNIPSPYRSNLQEGRVIAGYGMFPSIANLAIQVDNRIDGDGSPQVKFQWVLKLMLFLLLAFTLVVVSNF